MQGIVTCIVSFHPYTHCKDYLIKSSYTPRSVRLIQTREVKSREVRQPSQSLTSWGQDFISDGLMLLLFTISLFHIPWEKWVNQHLGFQHGLNTAICIKDHMDTKHQHIPVMNFPCLLWFSFYIFAAGRPHEHHWVMAVVGIQDQPLEILELTVPRSPFWRMVMSWITPRNSDPFQDWTYKTEAEERN